LNSRNKTKQDKTRQDKTKEKKKQEVTNFLSLLIKKLINSFDKIEEEEDILKYTVTWISFH